MNVDCVMTAACDWLAITRAFPYLFYVRRLFIIDGVVAKQMRGLFDDGT